MLFSGLLAKRPLYNLFMNKKALFGAFMDHFISQLDRKSLSLLEEGVMLSDLKSHPGHSMEDGWLNALEEPSLAALCGWKNLLKLSKRERECLLLLKKGYTCQAIGEYLKLSARTVEHYIDSVKNKLDLETRPELYTAAENLSHFDC